ncbi:MAG: PAS domain S-box protein [Lentimicrobium sp.]
MKKEKKIIIPDALTASIAENTPAKRQSVRTSSLSRAQVEDLILELEIQNENLRLANEQAEKASKKFSTLYDFAPNAYFTLSREGFITELNLSGAQMLGKERYKLINDSFALWISHDQRPDFENILKQAAGTGEKQILELQLETAVKSKLLVHLECIFLADDDRFLLSVVNISERRQSEELNRKQFFTLKGINESLSSPVFSVDTDYCYTSFNKAYIALMKSLYGAEIEIGKSLLDYITVDENRNIAKNNLSRTFKGEYHKGESNIGDTRIARKYFEILYNPTKDDTGEVIGASVLALDISERKHAEMALKQSEEQYRHMFTEMQEGFALHEIICDDQGKPVDYRFLDMNPAFEKLTGLKRDDTIGKTVLQIMPETELYWIKRYGKVALNGKSINFENYSAALNRHFQVVAFRPQPGQFAVLFNDITDRKRSELELKISEERFNKAFRNSPNAILITSMATGRIVEANEGLCRFSGYSMDELIGKSTFELNLWEKLSDREGFILELKKYGRVVNYESNFRKKSGGIFTGLISGEFLELQGVKFVLSVVNDITERKTIEQALRTSEEKWRMLVKTIPDYIALYDKNDNYAFLNHYAEGFSQQDIEGKHYSEFISEEATSSYKSIFENAKLTRETGYLEYTAYGDNQSMKHYESTFVPVFEGENYTNMMVIARDITERKLAEEELRKTRDYLQNLIKYANAPIIVWDNNYRITQFNKAFEQVSGLIAAEVLGKEVDILFPSASHAKSLEFIKQASAGDRWETVEIEIQHVDGSVKTLLWNSAAIYSSDGKSVTATIAQGQDITLRKKTLAMLEESEERFRLLLNSSAEGIYGTDASGNCTFCNKSALKMLGYTEIGEVLGRNMHDLIHHNSEEGIHDKKKNCRLFNAFHNGMEVHVDDEILWQKTGNSFPVELWSYPVFSDGAIIGSVVTFFDITERKKAEVALRESERQKATLISNLPGFVYRCLNDQDWTMQFISDGCKAITGYEPDGFIDSKTLSFKEIIDPDFIEPIKNKWEEILKDRLVFKFEYPILHANGETRWVWEQGQGIFSEQNELLYLEGFITDITERKLIQETIRASEEKLRTIIETSPDGISITSLDGTIQFVSGQSITMLGYDSLEEMIGLNSMDFLHHDYREKAVHYLTEMLKGNLTGASEYLLVRKDGSTFYVDINANVLKSTDNKPIGILYVQRDITERKIAEQILKESEEQHRLLLETAQEGILVAQGGKLSYFNQRIIDISGYSSEELADIDFINLVFPDDRNLMMDNYKKRLNGEQVDKSYTFRILCKDGSIRWVEISGTRIIWKGEVASLSFINDINEHRLALEALRESEARLSELNATKDKFFSIIAHDLKSPFNNIVALSNLLVEQIQNNEKEGIEEFAGLIQSSSQQAMSLLINLLDWSRSQTGRLVCSPEYVDIVALIQEVMDLMNETARQKSITLLMELPRNLLAYADKTMVSTIVRNLVSNAIKFTNAGGNVTVKAERNQSNLLISVCDNGVGIKPEAIGKLFRIEESISTKGTGNEKGTGLGLILCKEFVENHGGKIWAESEGGKGSKFSFTIPKTNFKTT